MSDFTSNAQLYKQFIGSTESISEDQAASITYNSDGTFIINDSISKSDLPPENVTEVHVNSQLPLDAVEIVRSIIWDYGATLPNAPTKFINIYGALPGTVLNILLSKKEGLFQASFTAITSTLAGAAAGALFVAILPATTPVLASVAVGSIAGYLVSNLSDSYLD